MRGHQCEECLLKEWNNKLIPLEIHHKDGDHLNNKLDNLQLLCPNCHSFTDNYRGRNRGNKREYSDDEFADYLKQSSNVRQALLKMGISASGGNYSRAYDIANKYKIKHILNK